MMARQFFIFALALVQTVAGHSEYTGKCPDLKPMKTFQWDKFREGRWYAMEKFGTSSKCLTYTFGGNDSGEMFVEQRSTLTGLSRFALPNKTIYKGRLVVPAPSDPANMIVRFPLSLLGTASFVVLDTDYDTAALVCTCQSTRIFFDVFTFHRRSCTILQRRPVLDEAISKKFYALLDGQIPNEGDEPAHHDFDVISHANCDYSDSDKGLQIDVDKIIGSTQSEIVDLFDDTLKVLRSKNTTTTEANPNQPEYTTILPVPSTENATNVATVREIEEVELNEIPVKDSNPKV